MLFTWNSQIITWFLNASVYTNFHMKLAQKILPYLKPEDTLCDIGCGLGRLDLELAPYVHSLTALDIHEGVITELQTDAVLRGLRNLCARRGDADTLEEEFDVVLMSFFGQPGVDMNKYFRLCRRRLIRVIHAENKGNLYPEKHRRVIRDTVSDMQKQLDCMGRKYTLEMAELEFGQPLKSWQDAEKFVKHNAPDAGDYDITAFLREKIIQTGHEGFPLYLPNRKELGIFVIDMEN